MDRIIIEQALQMRAEGKTYREISEHFGRSLSTLYEAMLRYDSRRHSTRSLEAQLQNYRKAMELYKELGHWGLVALRMNVSVSAISHWKYKFRNVA